MRCVRGQITAGAWYHWHPKVLLHILEFVYVEGLNLVSKAPVLQRGAPARVELCALC